ncbi:MAG: type IV pilus assembly protein PilM [Thermodesulfobacteriota bacterium]
MYSFQLTKNFIGIDFGSHSLKVAECQRAGEKVTLLNYEIVRLPQGKGPDDALSPQELTAFLRQTLKNLGIKTTDVASEVSGPWTVARHLYIPDLPDDEMREAIRWGSKADFPFALDDAVIDFYKLEVLKKEEGETEAEIISAVATREVVEDHMTLLKETGLKPLYLSIPAFSLMQVYRFTQPPPWMETVAVIDLGHKSTQIIVLKEGKLKFSREIAVAGDFFTQSLAGTYEVNEEAVEIDRATAELKKLKMDLGLEAEEGQLLEGIPLSQLKKRLEVVTNRLILEVERSLNYYKNQFKDYEIHKIFLTGGGSLLKGLPEILEKNMEIPIHTFQDAGALTLKKKINEDLFLRNLPFLTNLLGLITQVRPLINLSSQYTVPQARKLSPERFLKPALIGLVPLGVIFFFGSQYLTASRQVIKLQKDLAGKQEQMARMGQPSEELSRLEREEARLNQDLVGFPTIRLKRLPLKDLFKELPGLLPSNMTVTRLQLIKSKEARNPALEMVRDKPATENLQYLLEIQGTVFGANQDILITLSAFVRNLNRSRFYQEAKMTTTKKNNDYTRGAADFVIQAKLKE